MTARSFFDSNILIYTDDNDSQSKRSVALDLLEQAHVERKAVISTQVLQEYFVVVTRKLGIDVQRARDKMQIFGQMDVVRIVLDDVLSAVDVHRVYGFSFWDSLIIRAALRSGCKRLVTEDLQHGQRIEGLEIVNPFQQG
ncbi:MAG: PIN domain-containing protein [Deltaproteobacteria bacterium]|nr:PIN domain-containing protein [Deltaproteobacteria bacterium]